ncbi:DNA polymerase delta subunit 3, partial [Pseudocercospora fuligena]
HKLSAFGSWRADPGRLSDFLSEEARDRDAFPLYASPASPFEEEQHAAEVQYCSAVKMSQDYNEYLAVNVVNEQQYVTYRNLSRALKVHSNAAKQMLYEFHRKQNSKKPGSVHATYLLAGTKRSRLHSHTDTNTEGAHSQERNDQDGDVPMNSSPPMPSSSFRQPDVEQNGNGSTRDVVPIKSVMLVREEHLEKARAQFETIASIHIYSLQPNGLSDFQLLTDCNRRVLSEYANEDPLKEWKQYGVIQNANVRRRTRKNAPPIPPPAATAKKPEPAKPKAVAHPPQPPRKDSQDSKASTTSVAAEPATSSATKKGATSKKDGGLFKAFAKGAAKPKKSDSQQSSAAPSPPAEDAPMTGFSDDDDDNDDDNATLAEPEETKEPSGPSRKDRKAELEAMMDQEDESMDDAPEPADEPAPEDESQHDDGAIDKKAAKEEEPKETVTVENGRRRGRRRVMKKKTVKDEEGYLVTKEEPVWEEFSEEEPAPKKAKVSAPAPSSKAGEKKTAKKGQGNIMSFFGKR